MVTTKIKEVIKHRRRDNNNSTLCYALIQIIIPLKVFRNTNVV